MISIKCILLPTDFSDTSKEALKYALSMSTEYGARLQLLHVVNEQIFTEGMALPRIVSVENLERELCVEAARQMTNFLAGVPDMAEVEHETKIVLGTPWQTIVDVARAEQADLIVIGTHGRSGLEHMLFGSTAEKVVRRAPCPVLTVRPAQREFVGP